MKRLLISTDAFLPRWDGVTRFLTEIIPYLKEHFEITVLAPAFKGTLEEIPGVKIVRLPLLRLKFGDIYFARFARGTVRECVHNADLVFNQSIGPVGIMTINEARKAGIPIASYIHVIEWELVTKSLKRFRGIASFIAKKLARNLYGKCDLLLAPGSEQEMTMQNAGITTPIKQVSLGVDIDKFVPPQDKGKAKIAIGLPAGAPVIGFVGRIAREKDLHTLQRAFRKVKKRFPEASLLIVGDGLRKELLPDSRMRVTGIVHDVSRYLQAMDVFVLPSLTETSSLATMEAMACALPVLVTPVGTIPDYLIHEKNGWFFARRDDDDLARKIIYLLERPEVRARLGLGARQTITTKHKWSQTANAIEKALNEVLEKK